MKKSLIAAGAASLAVAAMPVVGVFADNITTMTDSITVTVESSCTFDAASHSHSKTMTANKAEDVGTTTMKVTCNDYQGYTVTGTFIDLSGDGGNKLTFTNAAPTAGNSNWAAYSTPTIDGTAGTPAYLTNNGEVIKNTKQTIAAGDTASIVYKASTANNQAAGAYTGTATYTLTKATH